MEVEEPSEKLDVFITRGARESTTVNGVKKPEVIENEDKPSEEEDKWKEEKGDRKTTRVVYSRDDLNDIRDKPASKLWPTFAEEDCIKNGVWDPEVWHHTPSSAKRCASPVEDIKRQIIIEDGIVLSPQRQSFGQGCHVPQSAPERGLQQERSKGLISRTIERDTRDGRSRLTGRVGRGSRSMDYRTSAPRDRNRNGDLRQTSPWERERNDKDTKRSKDGESYSYKRGRRKHDDDGDPEWMTYGPTSQLETIELRGFNKNDVRAKMGSFIGSHDSGAPFPRKMNDSKHTNEHTEKTTNETGKQKKNDDDDDADFDINQFFVADALLQFSDGVDQSNSNESRFCQFFGIGGGRGSQGGSRRSSAAEELLEYSGISSGSPSTPHTPSPSQKFMFTPIKPVHANTDPETLSEMLQKTKLDVMPLLESVLTSGKRDEMRVKGLKRLEDIEDPAESAKEQTLKKPAEVENKKDKQDMTAFTKLVENMKTSGRLPEKPQPVIPGLPSHLLPRPPSPKSKSSRRSPSPLQNLNRSASPVEFLEIMMQRRQSPSPPQVVPQLNRPYSPLQTPLYKTVDMLRRTPSPLNSMYDQKGYSPLLTPEAFMSPSPFHPSHVQNRPNPMMCHVAEKPHFVLTNESPKPVYQHQTPRSTNVVKPKVTPKTQSDALKDMAFMPTSVLQKIKKDQMTPKAKADSDILKKENDRIQQLNIALNAEKLERRPTPEMVSSNIARNDVASPERMRILQNLKDEKTLLKPTAFKPYQGMSPHSVSPLRSGVHSEPQSPATHITPASPRHKDPSSAPVTPHRHPQAEHHLLMNLQAHAKQLNSELSRPNGHQRNLQQERHAPPSSNIDNIMNHRGKGPDENIHLSNDMMSHHHPKRDYEQQRPMPLLHSLHQQQQQQLRREEMHNFANMGRPRPTPPLHMMGGHVSPQSMLGSPGQRTPYPNMHQGKPPMHPSLMRPLHPSYFRMMPPTRTPSGMPLQSPASLMQMMPPQQQHHHHPMMYRPGHTPMSGHHGYGGPINPQMMPPPPSNFPMQRPHPGYMHHQGKVPNAPLHSDSRQQSLSNDSALSKWFSDDVLRGMQSTTKHPTDNSSKQVMSVEDLERQQSLCAPLTF